LGRYDRVVSALAAVVFDFDGVILDSETPEYESNRLIYERCGATLTVEEWCSQIGIYTEGEEQRWFLRLCERVSQPPLTHQEYDAERRGHFVKLLPREPRQGIRELLEALRDAGVPAAIATSAPARWVVPAANRLGLAPLFQTIVSSDDVARGKPAPDVYLEATRRLGAEPAKSVAIEDSGPGLAAARAAGLKTVAIPHWLTERHELTGADLRVPHAGELTVARLATLLEP
jgi:putative hydrolase of the HAD superfamily